MFSEAFFDFFNSSIFEKAFEILFTLGHICLDPVNSCCHYFSNVTTHHSYESLVTGGKCVAETQKKFSW